MRFQKFSVLLTWMVSLTSLALSLLVLVYKDASHAPQEVSVPADSVYLVEVAGRGKGKAGDYL